MKKIILAVIVTAFFGNLYGQDNAINKFFSAYQNDEAFTKVNITSQMFDLFAEFDPEDEDEKELMAAINKLRGIKVLAKRNTTEGMKYYKEAMGKISGNSYEELMTVEDKDENIQFLIHKDKSSGVIKELLMLEGSDDSFVIMTLFGEIDLKQIYKIGKIMQINGLDAFEKMGKG